MTNELVVQILVIVATAVLSSLLTLALAYLFVVHRLRPLLEERLERRIEALRRELGDELGELIRSRVRQGFLEGVATLPSTAVLRKTQENMARTAADVVAGGLSVLWGGGEDDEGEPE